MACPGQMSRADGKFLEVDGRRFLVKGVAYGTFAPDATGAHFPEPARLSADFTAIAAAGFNTVRTYTVPSSAILDEAARNGLRVMVGLPWSQHTAFLDDTALVRQIRRDACATVRRLASHPASLMFAIGNEIPPGIVRWHGHRRIEGFLRSLCDEVKAAAPEALLTYVNFPPTDYLDLDCFDVCAFNVYLHREADLRAYLARLQHLAGSKPLLLAEAGGDSLREGLDGQARIAAMHVRAAFAVGACGAVAFSWTDEWWRGGRQVDDWAFGLVDADRRPKPALTAVSGAFAEAPFSEHERRRWPLVSVVVCAYNAADTIDDCLASLTALSYPRVEIIVVNDGSNDATAANARGHADVRVIDALHSGLSAARNAGLASARGEIVAYTDADVRVDPDWLTYLVQPLLDREIAGVGGPNVVPPDDPWMAQCVSRAPGGPTHVLLDDRIAEHVPGCNMAFRRDALLAVSGFNPVFLRAGDDVDVCWRLQARGLPDWLRARGRRLAPSPHDHRGILAPAGRLRRGRDMALRAPPRPSSPAVGCCGTVASTVRCRSCVRSEAVASTLGDGARRPSRRCTGWGARHGTFSRSPWNGWSHLRPCSPPACSVSRACRVYWARRAGYCWLVPPAGWSRSYGVSRWRIGQISEACHQSDGCHPR